MQMKAKLNIDTLCGLGQVMVVIDCLPNQYSSLTSFFEHHQDNMIIRPTSNTTAILLPSVQPQAQLKRQNVPFFSPTYTGNGKRDDQLYFTSFTDTGHMRGSHFLI